MKRNSFSQLGFSLMEVMIAVGITGIGALAWMSLQKSAFMGQKTLQAQDDARVISTDMVSLLSNPAACLATFGGLNPVAGTGVSALKNGSGAPQFSVGSVYGNQSLRLAGLQLGGPGTDPKTNLQKWTGNTPTTGVAFVSVEWEQTGSAGSQGTGPAQITRFFVIQAVLDGSKNIKSCVAKAGRTNITIDNGSGKEGYLPLWTGSTTLGVSTMAQSGGRIGIGLESPVSKLDVAGEIAVGSYAGTSAAPPNSLIVSGKVGIGTPSPSAALEVNGEVRLLGASSGSVALRAPAGTPATTWTLPNGDGAAAQVLTTDGTGVLTWANLCPGQTIAGCVVTAGITGTSSGACGEGYSGACSYTCMADKNWGVNNNTCVCTGPDCTPPLADCPAQTIDNCHLAATPSGGSSGTCDVSSPGACNYSCNDGTWTKNTNTCKPCAGYRYKGGCYYYTQTTNTCDTVCAGHGGCDQAATSAIDNATDCRTLQQALVGVPNQTQWFGNGSGRRGGCQFECFTNTSICWYDLGPTSACSDSPVGFFNPGGWRACGCNK